MTKQSRILVATDAWHPQVNGVVRTLDNTANALRELGHEVLVYSHAGKKTFALPSYPEIRLAYFLQKEVRQAISNFKPDHIHIATEGPLGFAMRKYCLRNGLNFTTGYHTRFAEYIEARLPIPGVKQGIYKLLRWFHKPSNAVLSPTKTISSDLQKRGFQNVVTWTRGVDHSVFRDYGKQETTNLKKPILLYVGRLSIEKGIDDFLQMEIPGTKLVIGDGPSREELESKYPDAVFTGYLFGEELAKRISTTDVLVFPSKKDTFGLVVIEAMACGVPVAAYPVMGPIDVVEDGVSGCLDDDLETAVKNALNLNRENAKKHAAKFTWENTAKGLFENLVPIHRPQSK